MLFYVGVGIIPLFILLSVELSLRLIGFGKDYSLVISDPEEPSYYIINPGIVTKYFPNSSYSGFGYENKWPKAKDKNAFRIAALGGSTTAGFPYFYNGSFPAILKQLLQDKYPDTKIELINLGMSAISSVVVNDLAKQTPDIDPDVVVIYCGHNEFYGIYGTTWSIPFLNYNWIKSGVMELRNFRLFQGIQSLAQLIFKEEDIDANTVMERMGAGQLFPEHDPARDKTFQQFHGNLNRMIQYLTKSDIPVILCTVSSNIKDQQPFRYPGYPEADISHTDEFSPLAHYALAWDYLQTNNPEKAKYHFTLARDSDEMPFRAPSEINTVIHRVASQKNIDLVDVEKLYQEASPFHIPDSTLFLEHVHPNISGNTILAEALVKQIEAFPFFDQYVPNKTTFTSHINITPLDSIAAQIQIKLLTENPPFKPTARISLNDIIPKNNIEDTALKLLKGQMNYKSAHLYLADYYQAKSLYREAVQECLALVEAFPYEPSLYRALVSACITAKDDSLAHETLIKLLALTPQDPFGNKWSGIYALKFNHNSEAIQFLKKAKRLKDDDQIRYNLSGAYLKMKQPRYAILELDTILSRTPNHNKARFLRSIIADK